MTRLPEDTPAPAPCTVCHDEPQTQWWPRGLGHRCTATLLDAQEEASTYLLAHYPELGTRIISQLYKLLPLDWAADTSRAPGPWLVAHVQASPDHRLVGLRNFGPRSLVHVRAVMPYLPIPFDAAPTHADIGLLNDLALALESLETIAAGTGAWDPGETAADALAAIKLQQAVRRLETVSAAVPEEPVPV